MILTGQSKAAGGKSCFRWGELRIVDVLEKLGHVPVEFVLRPLRLRQIFAILDDHIPRSVLPVVGGVGSCENALVVPVQASNRILVIAVKYVKGSPFVATVFYIENRFIGKSLIRVLHY